MKNQSIIEGLLCDQALISPMYFYDAIGSRLLELITMVPEYYLTRTEHALMSLHRESMTDALGTVDTLIDLGATHSCQARELFSSIQLKQYLAIDSAEGFAQNSLATMREVFPNIKMHALRADLTQPILLSPALHYGRKVCFYPGASIGHFEPYQALSLLRNFKGLVNPSVQSSQGFASDSASDPASGLAPGGLLIGVDLVKDDQILHKAYNDELGITAAFNRNILTHINRLISSDFKLDDWGHDAFFNQAFSRIEMHLYARRDVTVTWPGGGRYFKSGESIHTENSYKYQLDTFKEMLTEAGYSDFQYWTDPMQWYAFFLAQA